MPRCTSSWASGWNVGRSCASGPPCQENHHWPLSAALREVEPGGDRDAVPCRVVDQNRLDQGRGIDASDLRPGPANRFLLARRHLPDVTGRAGRREPEEERPGLAGGETQATCHTLGQFPGNELSAARLEEVEPAGPVGVRGQCQAAAVPCHREPLHVPSQVAGERPRRRGGIGEVEPVELVEVALPVGDEVDRLPVGREPGRAHRALSLGGRERAPGARRHVDQVEIGVGDGAVADDEQLPPVAGEVHGMPGARLLEEDARLAGARGLGDEDVGVLAVPSRAAVGEQPAVGRQDERLVPALPVGDPLASPGAPVEPVDLPVLRAAQVAEEVHHHGVAGQERPLRHGLAAEGDLRSRPERSVDDVQLHALAEAGGDEHLVAAGRDVEEARAAGLQQLLGPLPCCVGNRRDSGLQEIGAAGHGGHARRGGSRGLGGKECEGERENLHGGVSLVDGWVSFSEICQRRRAASSSRAAREGVFSRQSAKYRPVTPTSSGAVAT